MLLILKKRNANTLLRFYTPFMTDPQNVKTPYSHYEVDSETVNESIKIERFYHCDITGDKHLYLYDQFLDKSHLANSERYDSDIDFLLKNKAEKNIVYLNKSRDIEHLAITLKDRNSVSNTEEIEIACNAISDYVHPSYNLLDCLRKGVVYHHGAMPEMIRLYVESIFSKTQGLPFIVTSSTLLEGVNIPAEKIFLLTTKIGNSTFKKAQFKNLIGRICRFKEIFNTQSGSINMLEPEVYLVKGRYEQINYNHQNFLKQKARINIKMKDEVENVLLKENDGTLTGKELESLESAIEYVENIEPETIVDCDVEYVNSDIAKLCYSNNVYDFDIKASEEQLVDNLENFNTQIWGKIEDANHLLGAIYQVFINEITISNEKIGRLSNASAQNFYAMFVNWRTSGSSYNQMIGQFTGYWSRLEIPIIYVGSKWGEIKLDPRNHRNNYIDLRSCY